MPVSAAARTVNRRKDPFPMGIHSATNIHTLRNVSQDGGLPKAQVLQRDWLVGKSLTPLERVSSADTMEEVTFT